MGLKGRTTEHLSYENHFTCKNNFCKRESQPQENRYPFKDLSFFTTASEQQLFSKQIKLCCEFHSSFARANSNFICQ